MQFESAQYGKVDQGKNGSKFKKRPQSERIPDGGCVERVLPPLKGLPPNMIGVNHKTHWLTRATEDGDTKQMIVECPQVEKWDDRLKKFKTIKQCAHCTKINENKAEADRLREVVKSKYASKSADDRKKTPEGKQLAELDAWLWKNGIDRKVHLNTVDKAGTVHVRKISGKLYKALKLMFEQYVEKQTKAGVKPEKFVDPTSITNGAWINFERNVVGSAVTDVEYKVSFAQKDVEVDGEILKKADTGPLTEAQKANLDDAQDLRSLFFKPTIAQIRRIVDSDYSPEVGAEVFSELIEALKSKDGVKSETEEVEEDEGDEPGTDWSPPTGSADDIPF